MEISRVPEIINKTLATAGNEESEVINVDSSLPHITAIQIRSKTADPLQYGFSPGGPYVTIPAGATYWMDRLSMWVLTIYLVPSVNGQVAEIEVWR